MTLDEVRAPQCLLLEVIAGSRAYGTDTPESDTDMRGVFVQPLQSWLGLTRVEQVNNETNDIAFYELGRFVELLGRNNPNLLEVLFTPPDCVIYRHPLMDRLTPALFLSRLCYDAFAGYATTQIRKARGLNKKIVNPQPPERKGLLDFCYVMEGQGSVPVTRWLDGRGFRQEECALSAVPHMRDMYGLYHASAGPLPGARGIVSGPDTTQVVLTSIPREARPVAWMLCNRDGFKAHCKQWREYHDWVQHRNETRYQGTLAHGQGYDAKNLMHTFRLLDIAEEIARHGRITVRTPRREWLLQVKAGAFSYEELLALADQRLEEIQASWAESPLPAAPDATQIEATLQGMRRDYYRETGQWG